MLRCIRNTASNIVVQSAGPDVTARRGLFLTATSAARGVLSTSAARTNVPGRCQLRVSASTQPVPSWGLTQEARARFFSSGNSKNGEGEGESGQEIGLETNTDTKIPTEEKSDNCLVIAEYKVHAWWVVPKNVAESSEYEIRRDKLHVWWNEDDPAEIFRETGTEIDHEGEWNKFPNGKIKVVYEHPILDEHNSRGDEP